MGPNALFMDTKWTVLTVIPGVKCSVGRFGKDLQPGIKAALLLFGANVDLRF